MKYYVMEVGSEMVRYAEIIGIILKARGHQYLMFEVDDNTYFGMDEVSAQEFMNHHIISSNQYFDN